MSTNSKSNWQPLHEAHSIEVAAAAVNFSQPLTEVAWKKVVRDAEGVCKAAGLGEKSVVNAVQITIGLPAGPPPPTTVDAMVFMRSQATNIPGGGLQRSALEALTVSREGLNFQTSVYTRWDAFFERIQLLLKPPLRSALHSIAVTNLRLEYKDVFRFVGEGKPIAEELLNTCSDLIAPHVFRNEKLWHSHTGFFEDALGCKERLVQINVDANFSATRGSTEPPFRAVTITTAVQNNLANASAEALDNEDEIANSQILMFDSLHLRSKELFVKLISKQTASQVGIQ
ncbi:TIGR04255 family protein [Bradyrhizobium sp.]|jgi:uncharacterized protein (TIGR04255 family)|uniref:TIGR04255 family protein n=1 Tax=Bradyrhizobium sp. TaxID=376 RepID=UPI002E0A4786|nr:TIGR04255 family protein [Bradyrhizobium sp.]